mmetsp:Transcript_7580/g.23097  ORF Transcript_7580/g.23097 Transcript_7580/m.23097 type:complete len:207 (-) Transcript_7580:368-988(-)
MAKAFSETRSSRGAGTTTSLPTSARRAMARRAFPASTLKSSSFQISRCQASRMVTVASKSSFSLAQKRAIRTALSTSLRKSRATPRCWTLTATSRPLYRARWTWAMLAEASGTKSNSSNSAKPASASVAATCRRESAGRSSWSTARRAFHAAGTTSARVEMYWPILTHIDLSAAMRSATTGATTAWIASKYASRRAEPLASVSLNA